MNLNERKKLVVRNVVTTFFVMFVLSFCDRNLVDGNLNQFTGINAKDTIKCAIALGDEMYGRNGLKTGFNYELLRYFATDNNKILIIRNSNKEENYYDSLRNGSIDILVTPTEDSANFDGLIRAKEIDQNSVWLVNLREANSGVKLINHWVGTISNTDIYTNIKYRFYSNYDPSKRLNRGKRVFSLTPYDDLIKEYASQLDWDWRLLAAVIYQESRFSINSESNRGAKGLMQVMPRTAKNYGVTNLLDPSENLKAGVSHLARLERMFRSIDKDERANFILAAYNAGEGRIADCRNFTESRNLDKNKWDVVASTIPLMRTDDILQEDSVKLGKFYGYETLNYITKINLLYDAFCKISAI